jgi:hypothetical protein
MTCSDAKYSLCVIRLGGIAGSGLFGVAVGGVLFLLLDFVVPRFSLFYLARRRCPWAGHF